MDNNLSNASLVSVKAKKRGKKIGLITGCFDIVHAGHVNLFRFAKQHCDYLIIGLESDNSIKESKGSGRPFFSYKERFLLLSEFKSVDFIFKVESGKFEDPSIDQMYLNIAEEIKPDFLVTAPSVDKFWKEKEKRAKKTGAKILLYREQASTSTSKISEVITKTL